jgi:hypothetical protein
MAKRVRDIASGDEQGSPPQVARIEALLREEFATMPREMRAAIESHLAIRPLLRHAQASKELWDDVERPLRVALFDHILRNLDWRLYNAYTVKEKGDLEEILRSAPENKGFNLHVGNDKRLFRLFLTFDDLERSYTLLERMPRAQILSFYRETMEALVEEISSLFREWWTNMRGKEHLFRFMLFPTADDIPPLHWQRPVTGELCSITLSPEEDEIKGEAVFTVTGDDRRDPIVAKSVENFSDTVSFPRVRSEEIIYMFKDLLFNFFYDVSPACAAVFQDITPNVNASSRHKPTKVSLSTNAVGRRFPAEKD